MRKRVGNMGLKRFHISTICRKMKALKGIPQHKKMEAITKMKSHLDEDSTTYWRVSC